MNYKKINILLGSFNSTLVQLKGCSVLYFNLNKHCFNSTLVQLKVVWGAFVE